jgi:hypothetical protein
MGATTAMDLATNLDLGLEQAIGIHLKANHYPPIPSAMIPVCIEAIDAYWEDDTDRLIPLPKMEDGFQIRWRDGSTEAPAWAVIEHAHLQPWLIDDYEESEDE